VELVPLLVLADDAALVGAADDVVTPDDDFELLPQAAAINPAAARAISRARRPMSPPWRAIVGVILTEHPVERYCDSPFTSCQGTGTASFEPSRQVV
jgi:hypothetical protein